MTIRSLPSEVRFVGVKDALTGQRMVDRFTLRGRPVGISAMEFTGALLLVWLGLTLPHTFGPEGGALSAVESLYGTAALALGGVQLFGQGLAWLGIAYPHHRTRQVLTWLAVCWWSAMVLRLVMADSVLLSGVALTFAAQSLYTFRRAWLNGRMYGRAPALAEAVREDRIEAHVAEGR